MLLVKMGKQDRQQQLLQQQRPRYPQLVQLRMVVLGSVVGVHYTAHAVIPMGYYLVPCVMIGRYIYGRWGEGVRRRESCVNSHVVV